MSQLENWLIPLFATSIMESEYITMFLARLMYLCEHRLLPKSWFFPSGLRPTIELLGELVGSLGYVKSKCSLLPSMSRCLPPENVEALHGHFDHATQYGLMAKLGIAGPGSGWVKVRPARCPKCIEEDIAPDGLPFYRRDHLLPGIWFCWKHGEPVCMPCDRCSDFSKFPQYTRHAAFHCGCGLRPIPEAAALSEHHTDLEIEMAHIASRLLNDSYLPHLNHAAIGNLIAARSQELGIVEGGYYRADRAIELTREGRFASLIERTGLVIERSDTCAKLFKGEQVPRNVPQMISLLGNMHPTWEDVELRVKEKPAEIPRVPLVVRSEEVRKAQQEAKMRWIERSRERWFGFYAQKYAKQRTAHPKKNHVQLLRLLPPTASTFLTEQALADAGYDVPFFMRDDSYYQSLDDSFAAHIQAKAQQLIDTLYKPRISKYSLTRGHRMASNYESLLPHLPKTRAALARYQESTTAWKQRIARHPCTRTPDFSRDWAASSNDFAGIHPAVWSSSRTTGKSQLHS